MNELELLQPSAEAAGIKVTLTSLGFSAKPTDAQLASALQLLRGVERSRQWWWGDYILVVQRCKGAHYTGELVAIRGAESSTFMHYRAVAEFFKVMERSTTLPWSMHWMAWKVSRGDKAVALNWLQLAELESWSVRDMQAVAKEIGQFDSPEDMKFFRKLTTFERWAEDQLDMLSTMSADRRRELRERIPATLSLMKALSTT
jgi:hypothetical protein